MHFQSNMEMKFQRNTAMKFASLSLVGLLVLATGCGMEPSNPNAANPSSGTPHTVNKPIDQTTPDIRPGNPAATDRSQPDQSQPSQAQPTQPQPMQPANPGNAPAMPGTPSNQDAK
jgi:hypothetical protein